MNKKFRIIFIASSNQVECQEQDVILNTKKISVIDLSDNTSMSERNF